MGQGDRKHTREEQNGEPALKLCVQFVVDERNEKGKGPAYPFVNLMTVLKTQKLISSAQNGHSHGFGCLRDRGQNKVKPQRTGEDVRMCFVVLQGFGMPMRC